MTAVVVAFNGTRLDDSDVNTDWDNYNVSGGSPASEFPLAYQVTSGTTAGAVNKKVNSSTARQGVERYNATGHDMTATGEELWFCKVYVSDSFDLNVTWGVEVNMGSADNSNKHIYNLAGSGANLSVYDQYPAQGGYLITSIDPNIDTWAETIDSGGAFDQTAVRFFALGAEFVNGTAKAENVAMDAIDVGKGLALTNGDGADADGTFIDFVTEDQDDKTNRWGVVTGAGDVVRCNGKLEIGKNTAGTAVITEFTDLTSIVLFPDGYHSRGLVGVEVDLGNASTVVSMGSLLIGEGTRNGVDANDTRPDFDVAGTAGAMTLSGQLRNFRDIILTSAVDVDGADIECFDLTQATAEIQNSIVRCAQLANVAVMDDATFGTTTDIHDSEFVQSGVGHAIEFTTTTARTLTGVKFTGFSGTAGSNLVSSSGSSAAAIFNDSGGALTLTITGGGDVPSIRNGVGATTTVISTVTLTVTVVDSGGNPISGARVRIENASTGALVTNGSTNASGVYSDGTYNYTADLSVRTKVRLKGFKNFRTLGTITSNGIDVGVTMRTDPDVDLP